MNKENPLLLQARKNINSIDNRILELLAKRMQEVAKVTAAKRNQGSEIFAPAREIELLKRIEKDGRKLNLDLQMLREVYRSIIESSKRAQAQELKDLVRIGFQGPAGSFCESAARLCSVEKKTATYIPYEDITSIFKALEEQKIEFAAVPYQSSFELGAEVTVDLLLRTQYRIVGEVLLPLELALISPEKNRKLEQVEKLYGSTWLFTRLGNQISKILPHAEKCEIYSNSFYVDAIKDLEHKSVALGPVMFAELNKLYILKKLSYRQTGLMSRYVLIGRHLPQETQKDFLTLAIELPNKKGCLNQFTSILAKANISILNINLVYLRRAFCEHVFIVDLEGHEKNERVKKALEQIRKISSGVRVLGSYPAHMTPGKPCAKLYLD